MRRLLVLVPLALVACDERPMSTLDALRALAEVSDSGRGIDATTDPIEVSTEFTLGDALAAAAQEIGDFWESQAPCTTVDVAGNVTTIDYGDLSDACTYNGKTYGGVAIITVSNTTPGELEVTHDWLALTDGDVTVNGGATVTWTGDDETRHVVTDHTWTANDDGAMVTVHGDHVMGTLDGNWFSAGVTLDGSRSWDSDSGHWDLTFEGVEARWLDPAPQAGSFALVDPQGRDLDLEFSRLDANTIQAVLSTATRDWVFHIDALGQVKEQ